MGIIVGSIGTWAYVGPISAGGMDADSWGLITLIVGAASAVALFIQLNWGRTTFSLRWAVPTAWAVLLAGVGCLVIAVVNIVTVMSASIDWFGARIDVQVGWGLWMVAIGSALLCVTAPIVAVQVGKASEDYSQPSQAAWAGAWRWAAIIGSAVILLCGIVNAYSPITSVGNTGGREQATATRTVTATQTPPRQTVQVEGPTPAQGAGPLPAPGGEETVPPYSTRCPTNFFDSQFATSAVGSDVTSCEFAEAVRFQYTHQARRNTTVALNVSSPVTGQTYPMSCTGNRVVTCTGGTNAMVYLY